MDEVVLSLVDRFPVLVTVAAGILAAHGLALFIVNLTPTPRDNEVVGKVYKVVEYVAGVATRRAKEKGGQS